MMNGQFVLDVRHFGLLALTTAESVNVVSGEWIIIGE
jgi:hypothetical protein